MRNDKAKLLSVANIYIAYYLLVILFCCYLFGFGWFSPISSVMIFGLLTFVILGIRYVFIQISLSTYLKKHDDELYRKYMGLSRWNGTRIVSPLILNSSNVFDTNDMALSNLLKEYRTLLILVVLSFFLLLTLFIVIAI
ncbi:MAG: hypothetical protein H6551_01160 [Chitinophagales bacterium]|nr:hypothetical protein [Chitinophagaceae bacterium]MCB9063733.1 hypothetical protein [Chitinophagales bacterium]